MIFLFIVGGVCLVLGITFGLFDRYPDEPDDGFVQSTHCRTVTAKERTRT